MMSAQPVFPSPAAPPSHLRPSLFELLAQEQLRDLLHPVVRYVLSVGTQFSIQRSSLK
jgi:peroxin-12